MITSLLRKGSAFGVDYLKEILLDPFRGMEMVPLTQNQAFQVLETVQPQSLQSRKLQKSLSVKLLTMHSTTSKDVLRKKSRSKDLTIPSQDPHRGTKEERAKIPPKRIRHGLNSKQLKLLIRKCNALQAGSTFVLHTQTQGQLAPAMLKHSESYLNSEEIRIHKKFMRTRSPNYRERLVEQTTDKGRYLSILRELPEIQKNFWHLPSVRNMPQSTVENDPELAHQLFRAEVNRHLTARYEERIESLQKERDILRLASLKGGYVFSSPFLKSGKKGTALFHRTKRFIVKEAITIAKLTR